MDSDPIDHNLLLQFTCLGTSDRDDLVKQFRELIDRVNDDTASFYLEMNNWNLQNAICSFLDYQPRSHDNLSLEKKEELAQAQNVAPNSDVFMWWTVRNNGTQIWPSGCVVRCIECNFHIPTDHIPIEALHPGRMTTVVLDIPAPSSVGQFSCSWQATTPNGHFFGEVLRCTFYVSVNQREEEEEQRLSDDLAMRMALNDPNDGQDFTDESSRFVVQDQILEPYDESSPFSAAATDEKQARINSKNGFMDKYHK